MVWFRKKKFNLSYLIQFLDTRRSFNIMDYHLFIYLFIWILPT